MKFIAGLATGSLIACAMALAVTPARAEKKEHRRKATDDYAVSHPAPVPVQPRVANGSIFQVNDGYAALYEGQRARRVGDTLSIVLVEKTTASKSSGTKLDSGGGFSLTPPSAGPLSFNPGAAKVSGARNFGGTGTADQSNALSGEVSVTVAEVYPNGTMLVQGQKRVTLNRGDEFVQIKGIVRVADIDENNRIPSTRVADARISYTGKGDVARAARQGWLSRFFQILSPF